MRFHNAVVVSALLLTACIHGSQPAQVPVAGRAVGRPATSQVAPGQTTTPQSALPKPPETAVRPVTETIHGITVTDPYRWLEDQESPETRDWIARENAYTDAVLGEVPRADIEQRVMSLLNTDVVNTPVARSGRYFYTKRAAGQDLFSICMREGLNGPEEMLIDPAPMSPKHTTSVSLLDISNDGKLMAYSIREGGADETAVHFFDVDARRDLADALPRARYQGLSILPGRRDVYYSVHSSKTGPRVLRHVLGKEGADQLTFGEGYGPEKIISNQTSDDGRYLLITVYHGSAPKKTELYLKDLRSDGPLKTIINDMEVRSSADFAGDSIVIQTNWNAPNDRIMIAPAADPSREHWKELVPERKDAAIQSTSAAGGKVWVDYLENVHSRLVGYSVDGKPAVDVAFETLGTLGNMAGQWSDRETFFSFSSFHVPPTIYRYDSRTGERQVFARQNAPVDPDHFELHQVWYASKDGTRIPMFLLYRKGLDLNGANPTYLTGYGGFTASQLPRFSATAVLWAEHGGVYALPNLRGGSEFGEAWHQAGMRANKQNVFDDFTGAADYLIANRYTSPSKLAIRGASNGGLLVGTAMTQHPELFKAIVVGYPLLDMLRYDRFMVGSFWVPEYGSASDPEQFKWLAAYSPYQHVVQGTKYPAVLFLTGDADTRVAPLHARKMAALMQASTGSDNPVLIRYHTSSGHSGGEPLAEQVKNEAEVLAFLFYELGVR
jgi:prolyl oligopeptidase